MEPSGSTFRGSLQLSEVSLSGKKGLKTGGKSINFFCSFFAKKDAIHTQSWWEIDERENSSLYMPKNSPKVGFKPIFWGENMPFFATFCRYLCLEDLL